MTQPQGHVTNPTWQTMTKKSAISLIYSNEPHPSPEHKHTNQTQSFHNPSTPCSLTMFSAGTYTPIQIPTLTSPSASEGNVEQDLLTNNAD
jgi:hypothetical protein